MTGRVVARGTNQARREVGGLFGVEAFGEAGTREVYSAEKARYKDAVAIVRTSESRGERIEGERSDDGDRRLGYGVSRR